MERHDTSSSTGAETAGTDGSGGGVPGCVHEAVPGGETSSFSTRLPAGPPTLHPAADAARSARSARPAGRTWAVTRDGDGPPLQFHLSRVSQHPVRACYPFGAHDLIVTLALPGSAPSDEDLASRLLRQLVPDLFATDARCRRIVAAPDEHDAVGRRVLAAGGFREITEAELPDGDVMLFAAERPEIAGLSTALDDMPH